MIVQCPECQTKYNLPDSKISPGGTKVRCSRCTHTFTAFPAGAAQEPEPAPQLKPEVKPAPEPEPARPKAAAAEPEDDLGLGDLGLALSGDEGAPAEKAGKAGKSGLGADFDEDEFLASLGDLGDLGDFGKDPFSEKKDSDEPSFSDDFLKADEPASAKGRKSAASTDFGDEDLFGGLDELLGDKPETKPAPADDLGLDGIDFGDEPAGSARDRKEPPVSRPATSEPEAAEEKIGSGLIDDAAWAGLDDEPAAAPGGARAQTGEAEQEVGDEDFEAALRNLSMDLDGDARPAAGKPVSRKAALEQTEAEEDLWPGVGGGDEFAATGGAAAAVGLSLDEPSPSALGEFSRKSEKKKGGALKLLLFLLLFVLLLLAGGVAAIHHLGLWTSLPQWVQELGRTARLPVGGGMAKPAEDQVRLLSLENIRQYTVQNDKAGQVFVIEGKVVNNFPGPRELIRVQASLYDQAGGVVVSKDITAGNTVSLFQLQIMSPQEIEAALGSDAGIMSSNSNVQTGGSVPFMAVFFNAPESVAEFGVKIIEAREPAK